ncbi:hypothetical protein JCGZ_19392 [Jatropha curcas]|uniref:Uncharacterized protein n=1 Tax=Jatropha curcas TaxID=180498 RepID=A0A067KBV7_JATCU|nr:hypothetical protein JCGZ_19392 [Jatropha curcas]
MEGQDNSRGEAARQAATPPPQTTDPQVATALTQVYLQFTTVLKHLLETPHLGGELMPLGEPTSQCHKEHGAPPALPRRQSHLAFEQLHEAESEANLSMAAPYSQGSSHTQPVMNSAKSSKRCQGAG